MMTPEQLQEVRMLLAVGFVQQHVGYRLNRILVGTVGDVQGDYQESSGVFRIVRKFGDSGRRLAVMTRKDAFSVSGSIAASLFQYQAPILGLRDSEKRLLSEALTLRSDIELAARMNLSPATIKKRWQALFDRVADMQPGLLPVEDEDGSKLTRGPQKRHHVLAYVRSHPQELRPYRWRSFKEA
jgi:DNA-binding CsgD family transcriptional regulator